MNESKEKLRLIITFVFFCTIFILILSKAFYVQVINRNKLIAYSRSQIFRESKVYPNRGNIYDRNGSPLALNVQTYSIFALPQRINDEKETYKTIAELTPGLSLKTIKEKLSGRNKYTWLARKIPLSREQAEEVGKLDGIYVEAVPKRIYPNQELLSQVLGFVGVDNTGLSGVEYLFDEKLKGKPRIIKYLKDAKGRAVSFESATAGEMAEDLFLTIDKDLQAVAEKYLKEAVIEHNALKGGIGVMDVATGEILAMANYPAFNPNTILDSKEGDRKLAFVSDPFEPGSTFKIITAASALENSIAKPDTNYYCERGSFRVQDHIISEAEAGKNFEWMSLTDIIAHSSNIGTTKVAFDLTYPKLRRTLKAFNIGEKTGIELPAESRGIFKDAENVTPLSLSNFSFGQGIATTGIQMLSVYTAIASGGEYVTPTIIKGTKNEKRRILSAKTAEQLTAMLLQAVEKGTGANAKIPYFKIAGKTSTAQKPDKYGVYSEYIPGFIGFPVNAENKFVVYVYIDAPHGKQYYGNSVAAPVFKKVVEYILYKNKEFEHLAVDSSKLREDNSSKISQFKNIKRVYGDGVTPNFIGLDKRSASDLAEKAGLKIKAQGIGVVVSQDPGVGVSSNKNKTVELSFEPPKYE